VAYDLPYSQHSSTSVSDSVAFAIPTSYSSSYSMYLLAAKTVTADGPARWFLYEMAPMSAQTGQCQVAVHDYLQASNRHRELS